MEIRKGIPVSPGYAIGEVFILGDEEYRIPRKSVSPQEIDIQIKRFEKSSEDSVSELKTHLAKFSKKLGESATKIIESYISMLKDEVFKNDVNNAIKKDRYSAEYAISRTIKRKIKILGDWGNHSFSQKIQQDLLEIEKTLIGNLLGSKRADISRLTKKVIIVAKDLSPAQTIALDKEKILGILTDVGGRTSHSAIIASSLGIPAVVGLGNISTDLSGGDTVILDGSTGTVIINPDEDTIKRYIAMERNFILFEKQLTKELKDLPTETIDGHKIKIYANVETPDEIQSALNYGAEGIGLYRTEFLFLNSNYSPSEKDHIETYTKAISMLGRRRLVIRTLDLGADKMPTSGIPKEANPFLGTRAIRLCFQQMDLFKTQLRAILKVSTMGNVSILFPMVSSYDEVVKLKEIIEDVKSDLRKENKEYNDKIEVGIMIEVPSAALVADILINHVDFFSIGTNDLIAYSIAVDRSNERVANLYQPAHPSILRLLKQIIDIGNKHNKHVSVCGEMASDITYTLLLLGMGLKVFSVVTPAIPEVKKIIRSVKLDDAKEIAREAFSFTNAPETVKFLKEKTRAILPDVV